jgi:hypothetical protein
MKQFSPILTKVNKQSLPYKVQVTLKKQPPSPELLAFVKHMHPNADLIQGTDNIKACTTKDDYYYYNLGTYFKRVKVSGNSPEFYKVS